MQEVIFLGQILLSVILGGILGWQRERLGKSAGPRTYGLVAAGATLFTILALHAFPRVTNSINIAAQIVTGVGFLGAGMIIHRDNHVDNLTTAAGFWAMAAIGMAVGASLYILSVGTTLIILAVFIFNDQKYHREQNKNT